MNKQNFNDKMLGNEAYQINLDFTLLEQLKLARNILQLVHGDLFMQQETEEDNLTIANLGMIADSLDKIIKKYEVEE